MNRRKWALVILVAVGLFTYVKFFYKTWSEEAVTNNADCIMAIDVKRVTNTLIWNFITTPSRWRPGKMFSRTTKDSSWRDMFSLPDYVFIFHVKGETATRWYAVLEKKNETGFEAGLNKFSFEKLSEHEFVSAENGIYLYIQGKKILTVMAKAGDSVAVRKVARDLFADKKFIARNELQKLADASSHLAIFFKADGLIQDAGLITANIDKQKVSLEGSVTPLKHINFKEDEFLYSSNSLFSLGFTQPAQPVYSLLDINTKERISKALGLDADSVFAPSNRSYSLTLTGVKERADTAITYTYDDEFNKVEKSVVNKIQEPSFSFFINGKDIDRIQGYLRRNNKLEATGSGDVFLPMPLVRSYCRKSSETSLSITSINYDGVTPDMNSKSIIFFRLNMATIPDAIYKYLPDGLKDKLMDIDLLNISVYKENSMLKITGMLTKRKNSVTLFGF